MNFTWYHFLGLIPVCIALYTLLYIPDSTPDLEETENDFPEFSLPEPLKTNIHTVPASIKEYRLPDGSKVVVDTAKTEVDEKSAI